MAGIGIITNPHSKLNKRNPERSQLLSYIAGEHGVLKITNTLEELDKVARDFARKNVEVLAINGGDGTISRTITAFIHAYGDRPLPAFALLRGGTMNMLAENLGILGNPEQLLFKLITAYSLGSFSRTTSLRTLAIDSNFGFLFANGTSARFLAEFYKNKTSAVGSIKLVIMTALSSFFYGKFFRKIVRNDLYTLRDQDQPAITVGACSIFCATVSSLPLRIELFPGALERLKTFECVGITYDEKRLVRNLPFIVFTPRSQRKHLLCMTSSHLQIEGPNAESSLYTLDGELYYPKSNKVTLEVGPELKFVIP